MKPWLWQLSGPALILMAFFAPLHAGDTAGLDLAHGLGCFACHQLNGRGGKNAAPLDHIGSRLHADDLKTALTHPRSRRPGAKMPNYNYLRPEELQVLLDYLKGLK